MNGYERLRPYLVAVAAGGEAIPLPHPDTGPRVAPGDASDAASQARAELACALTAVGAAFAGRPADAAAALATHLDAPLRPSPFETLLEEAGARLASGIGDGELAARFLERRHAYLARFGAGAVLAALAACVSETDLLDDLAATLGPTPDAAQPAIAPPSPVAHAAGGFVPFAANQEAERPAYVVTVRHLEDARTATFAVHRVTWHDLEAPDPTLSDLVLAFEADAVGMLRRLDPEALRLRLFFGDGAAFDEVGTSNGSLFDVEVNPAEGRIYLKLRQPVAWLATDLPAAEIWSHLHSCVLISEDG
ncbi:MAG: hypothetical protein H0U69_15855 [Trueperaceae bacterium]|nr:hypothetical protein [Trueperaceae bacterium]